MGIYRLFGFALGVLGECVLKKNIGKYFVLEEVCIGEQDVFWFYFEGIN